MQRINYDEVTNITKNSKQISDGVIYCCFIGNKFDGHDYIEQAFTDGAPYVIGSKEYEHENYIKVEDVNAAMAKVAQEIFDYKNNKMKLIGITGTDGKTSTALIITTILNKISKASYLGTSGFFLNGVERDYNGMTTPFADELYENIKIANDAESEYFTMEVSSHSLVQKRAYGLLYDVAVFTNLTNEHIDFHGTMENYYEAKKELFSLIAPNGTGVVNIDSEYGLRLYNELKSEQNLITVGESTDADYVISNIQESLYGTSFDLTFDGKTHKVNTKLLVEFNVYNLTEALVALVSLGYDLDTLISLSNDFVIEGRMELIENKGVANVIIDFAHTPDAIFKIMEFVEKQKNNERVYVVTGSAGERDSSKRPQMGRNAAHGADVLILTEDDPRSESVASINQDLKKELDLEKIEVVEIENREEAIKYALTTSTENDIIILLGKGGQKVMYYDGYTTEFMEKEITKQLVKEVQNERK